MSRKIPLSVAIEIKERVFEKADRINYLMIASKDSSAFLNELVTMVDVGGEIKKYVSPDQVRHYIKDAILNKYSKNKANEATPDDIKAIVRSTYKWEVEKIYSDLNAQLFKSIDTERKDEYVVTTIGTVMKWETALRKALLFISASPFLKTAGKVHITLLLFAKHKPVPPSDKKNLENVLERCGAKPYIFGEK